MTLINPLRGCVSLPSLGRVKEPGPPLSPVRRRFEHVVPVPGCGGAPAIIMQAETLGEALTSGEITILFADGDAREVYPMRVAFRQADVDSLIAQLMIYVHRGVEIVANLYSYFIADNGSRYACYTVSLADSERT